MVSVENSLPADVIAGSERSFLDTVGVILGGCTAAPMLDARTIEVAANVLHGLDTLDDITRLTDRIGDPKPGLRKAG